MCEGARRRLTTAAVSADHSELGAGELALEEPVAEVDCQVNLVVLWNVNDRLLVLHVHRHKLVAYLWRVLRIVNQTKLFVCNVVLQVRIILQLNGLALDLLAPPVLVEALSEEDHVGEHRLVVALVYSVAHTVQVEGENLVHKHHLAVVVSQEIVVALPLGLGIRWNQSFLAAATQATSLIVCGRHAIDSLRLVGSSLAISTRVLVQTTSIFLAFTLPLVLGLAALERLALRLLVWSTCPTESSIRLLLEGARSCTSWVSSLLSLSLSRRLQVICISIQWHLLLKWWLRRSIWLLLVHVLTSIFWLRWLLPCPWLPLIHHLRGLLGRYLAGILLHAVAQGAISTAVAGTQSPSLVRQWP